MSFLYVVDVTGSVSSSDVHLYGLRLTRVLDFHASNPVRSRAGSRRARGRQTFSDGGGRSR